MKSNICFSCQRVISEHSRGENIECALKLCNGKEVVDSTCGINEPLDQKPTSGAVNPTKECF